jgi:hypothetical protein
MGDMIVRHIQGVMVQDYKLTEQLIPLHEVVPSTPNQTPIPLCASSAQKNIC